MEKQPEILDRLQLALELHRKGLRLVPLRGKIALVKGWQHLHLGESDILAWGDGVNWGAITGDPLVVLDTDTEAAERWVRSKGIESGVMVRSGGGGMHRWFVAPEGMEIHSKSGMHRTAGLDVKAWHSYIVLPGAIHPDTGRAYEFLPGKQFGALHELPTFNPEWVKDVRTAPAWTGSMRRGLNMSGRKINDVRAYIRGIASVQGQHGSNACFRVAALLFDAGYSQTEALAELEDWNECCAVPLWSRAELVKKVTDVWRKKMQANLTNDGR